MRKIYVIIIGSLVALSLLSYGYCEESGDRHVKHRHKDKMDFFANENLTAEQIKLLQGYREQYRKKMQGLRADLKGCRERLHKELESASPDSAKINEIAALMKQAQATMLDTRIAAILHMKSMIADMKVAEKKKTEKPDK